MKQRPACVLGAGSWGTVIASLLAENGREVRLYARKEDAAHRIHTTRENEVYLPGMMLPRSVRVTSSLQVALDSVELLVMAVPARAVKETAQKLVGLIPTDAYVVSASKGFEPETLETMTGVLARELGESHILGALSGPNLASEIAAGQPAAAVLACAEEEASVVLQEAFTCLNFRTYTSKDVLGVELCGALKNVLALSAGMLAELGYGANSQAALLTRGLAEMTRLGVKMGAHPLTFQGLAGMGDVLATCSSSLSRNYRAGRMAARGLNAEAIRKAIGQAVEGLATAEAACQLGRRYSVEMPVAEEVFQVVHHSKDPRAATRDLMTRPPRAELEGALS